MTLSNIVLKIAGFNPSNIDGNQERSLVTSILFIYFLTLVESAPIAWLIIDLNDYSLKWILACIGVFYALLIANNYLVILNARHQDETTIRNNQISINWTSISLTIIIVAATSYTISLVYESYFFGAQIRTDFDRSVRRQLEEDNFDRFSEMRDSIQSTKDSILSLYSKSRDPYLEYGLDSALDVRNLTAKLKQISRERIDSIKHFLTSNHFDRKIFLPLIQVSGLIRYKSKFDSLYRTRLYKVRSYERKEISHWFYPQLLTRDLATALINYSRFKIQLNIQLGDSIPPLAFRLEELYSKKSNSGIMYVVGIFTWFVLAVFKFIPILTIRRTARDITISEREWRIQNAVNHDSSSQVELEDALNKINGLLEGSPENIDLLKQKAEILRKLNRSDFYEITSFIKSLEDKQSVINSLQSEIKLKKLELINLDFFGTTTWDFEKGSNILLGKNGYGKTHLLTLVIGLLQRNSSICNDFFSRNSSGESSARLIIAIKENNETKEESIEYSKSGFKTPFGIVPILSISELRFIDKSSELIRKPDGDFDYINKPSDHFLKRLPLGDILNGRLYALSLDLKEGKTNTELIQILENVFTRLTGKGFKIAEVIREGDTSYKLMVRTGGSSEPLPIQKVSQGTLSVFSIISLIYKFLESTSTHSRRKLQNIATHFGVVIIDEIDAHLHPSWQQKLVGIFRDVFPNVQLIIASHSPLIVAGSKENEVNVLRKNEDKFSIQQIKRHFIGATTDELYQGIFDVEEKDDTYLKYAGMKPFKNNYLKELEELKSKVDNLLTPDERSEFKTLKKKEQSLKSKISFVRKIFSSPNRSSSDKEQLNKILDEEKLLGLDENEVLSHLSSKSAFTNEERKRYDFLLEKKKGKSEDLERIEDLKERVYYIEQFEEAEEKRTKFNQLKEEINSNSHDKD